MNRDRDLYEEEDGLRDLGPERALDLLGRAAVGRVVYTIGALPAVLPVPFRLVPGGVLLAAGADADLVRAVDGAVIAFEADEVDAADGSGWCVTVLGRARAHPADPADAADAADPAAAADVRILIRPELVTGRRLPSSRLPGPGPVRFTAGGKRAGGEEP
ncbi:pyridoxamine 5'-phosphate oxidase family protein [Streptomyces rubellomurinus]|uniref:pyridoxamine 5'-phosphate oxidase family protein n=1 Tax=Streptomyces rubellomurinus (strain ATCC 31215) TaxID=359131 RepID=UPI0007C805DF|nr:pyridoxamine 5'-phosphate oxidase family protein [Streptomyces rubellomurinus]